MMQLHRSRVLVAAVVLVLVGLTVPEAVAQFGKPPKLPDTVELEVDIPYADTDNTRLRLNLLLPKARGTERPLPVIVYIHGGAWLAGDRAFGHGRLAGYVSSGEYAGVSVGYRLTREAKWPAQIHDCKAAIRWLRGNARKYNLDPDRIGVIGDSAGGHLVAMLGTSGGVKELEGNLGAYTDASSRVFCVVDEFGPSNLLAMKDYPSRLNHDEASSPEGMLVGGRVSENKEVARAASPVTYVSKDDPPFLIIHGNEDMIVPYNQSERLSAALKMVNVECCFTTVDGGGHGGFQNPEVQKRERQFFDKHLRGAKQVISEETIPNSAVPQVVPSLKAAVGSRFRIGVGVGHQVLQNLDDAELIRRHFQILTPENCMKPQGIHPNEDRWDFEQTDAIADFVRTHKLEMVGHCLVWAKDDRTDEWMMHEGDGAVSREKLLQRIQTHVETVVGRYADVATQWDVVNEAIGDSNDGLLRDSVYSRTAGLDFIVTAFKAARAKDRDALLIYNDYNGHKPEKRKKLIELLTQLKAAGAPVDAYGMQGHFELGDNSLPQLRETFDELRKLGLKVVVSELDIDVVTRGRWWADDGKYRDELKSFDPYKDGMPPEIEKQMVDQYVALFQLFDEYSDIIARVSFWNLHDGQSWLNYFPWRRVNHPLLFDRNRQPKPAFSAVYESLTNPKSQGKATSYVPLPRNDANSREAHKQLLAKTKQGRIDVYFQGDSITRRWGATDYPKLLAHWKRTFHGWNAANFAWGGDDTHHILWRMQNGELDGVSPKVVCLQAGANNLPWRGPAGETHLHDVVGGIQAIIAECRSRFPGVPIVLTAMFPRDQNPELSETIASINDKLESMSNADKRIHWININPELVAADGKLHSDVSSDGLHLEEPGYEIWAKAVRPVLTQLLGPPSNVDHAPPPTGNPGL